MKIKNVVLPALLVALAFASCDDFFSDSLGGSSRDKNNFTLSSGNARRLEGAAITDSSLRDPLVGKVIAALEGGSLADEEKFTYSDVGINTALVSSGLSEALLANDLGSLTDLLDDNLSKDEKKEKVKDLISGIQDDLLNSGGSKAADDIATIIKLNLEDPSCGDGEKPQLNPDFRENAEPGYVAEAVVVLVMGELGTTNIDTLSNWEDISELASGLKYRDNSGPPEIVVDSSNGGDPSTRALALAAYLNLIVSDDSGKFGNNSVTGAIREAFMNRPL